MSGTSNSKALRFIQQNLSFFITPFKAQHYFRLWATKSEQIERLRPLSNNLHVAIGIGHDSHIPKYVMALLGHLVDQADVCCLLFGDERRMRSLLNENKQLASAILAFKDSSVIEQWNLSHPIEVAHTNKVNELSTWIRPLSIALTEAQIKGCSLKKSGHAKEAEAINWLTDKIAHLLRKFVENPDKKQYLELKIKGLTYIKTVKPKLKAHRGWKQIFGNLALAIAGVGVIYGVAISCNKIITGNYLFFKTDSTNKIDELQHCIAELELPFTP